MRVWKFTCDTCGKMYESGAIDNRGHIRPGGEPRFPQGWAQVSANVVCLEQKADLYTGHSDEDMILDACSFACASKLLAQFAERVGKA